MKKKAPFATVTSWMFIFAGGAVQHVDPAFELLTLSLLFLGIASHEFHRNGAMHNTPEHRADEGGIYAALLSLLYYAWFEDRLAMILFAPALYVLLVYMSRIDLFFVTPIITLLILVGIGIYTPIVPLAGLCALVAVTLSVRRFPKQTDFILGIFHVLAAFSFFAAFMLIKMYS